MTDDLSSPQGVQVIRDALAHMPHTPGVYRMIAADGATLYVGKARALPNRVAHYTQLARLPLRLQRMVMATARMDISVTASEAEALLLEARLIKELQPRYNIQLRDDKMYPYIRLDRTHAFPRISKYRGPLAKPHEYFGPFASASAVDDAIRTLQKAFLLRPCADTVFKNRARPCLQYQIKRCSAPCVGLISETDYAALVAEARRYLHGHGSDIQAELARTMEAASANLDYERAAALRDRIRALTHVQAHSQPAAGLKDADVFSLAGERGAWCVWVQRIRGGQHTGGRDYMLRGEAEDDTALSTFIAQLYQREAPPPMVLTSHALCDADVLAEALSLLADRAVEVHHPQRGDKRALVEAGVRQAKEALTRHVLESAEMREQWVALQALLALAELPQRVEIYDNSHIRGTHAVGAMVVAGAEGFRKKDYRTYRFPESAFTPGDDYAMLRHMLTRRFQKLAEGEGVTPSLVIIDGGANQLAVAESVLAELGISDVPLLAISKGPDRNAGREWLHVPGREAFQLPEGDARLHLLQRLRDEAHRFAIGTHRNARSRAAGTSPLDALPGLGPSRKRALLHHFGSAKAALEASVEELAKVPGISKALAEKWKGVDEG